jgi:hypothetical protein
VVDVAALHGALAVPLLWLEFSQSFQVLAILASTLAHAVALGYRFWVDGVEVRGRGTWYATCEILLHFGSKMNP